jgi:hypothetical protein
MKRHYITDKYFYVRTRDRIGGTVRTDIFLQEDGLHRAYSTYWQDEDERYVGFGESDDPKVAIRLSRKELQKEWIEKENPNDTTSSTK